MIQFIVDNTTNNSVTNPGFEVVRLMVVPILSLITAAMAISVFFATYFIVFRIRKYLKRHKNYLNFTEKLSKSFCGKKVNVFRPYKTTMWGKKLEDNKKLIGKVLTQYKDADLKDLILGTYNDELNSVKAIINSDNKLIKNNHEFIKFQRLFHIYKNDKVILEYFNPDYISFYNLRKSGVIIGLIKREELEKEGIEIKNNVDFSKEFSIGLIKREEFKKENIEMKNDADFSKEFLKKLDEISSIYKIYFLKRNFIFKNISNPIPEFEKKLSKKRKIFNKIIKKRYSHYNVYLKENFKNFPKLNKLIEKNNNYLFEDDLLLELFIQKPILTENIISEKRNRRKEIKALINSNNKKKKK